jgi:DNA-binding NarL/FixJ family response regulator
MPDTALKATDGMRRVEEAEARPQLRVLIVDDQYLSSEFLRVWVEALGHEVTGIACTAREAAEKAAADKPDVVLMDMILEGQEDGVDATLLIRKTQNPPIIFITGCAEANSVTRIMSVQPLRILPKPVEPNELFDALRAASQASEQARATA